MRLINLTPHEINIIMPEGTLTVPPAGTVARVSTVETRRTDLVVMGANHRHDIPIVTRMMGSVEGLPEPKIGIALIVSAMVAHASPREDVYSPGDLVRGANGQPVGCRGLVASK